jgi:glycosyltransferase involved in cell wall biosynthesis
MRQIKKITHIIEATATGTLSMASLLANRQAKNGHTVSVIYSQRLETPADFAKHFDKRIDLINIQMSSFFERLTCFSKIRNILKSSSPDFVFMHSSFAGFFGRLSSLGAVPNTKFFYLPHCISFMRKDIGYLKTVLFICFEWIASLKNADYVACSESERKVIAKNIPFRKCHLVENAIDFAAIPQTSQQDLSQRTQTVITVGQIRPQKGPEFFSTIALAVKSKCPHIEFIWVGDGDAYSRQQLEHSEVRVTGWVPKDEVWEYLGDSCLYLSTALWEGMPVSLIEASFAGLPVVASSCAGNVDVVAHGKTGWLFHTPAEATEYILSSFEDPDSSQSIAKMAFDIARQRFSVERYFQEMESLTQSKSRKNR